MRRYTLKRFDALGKYKGNAATSSEIAVYGNTILLQFATLYALKLVQAIALICLRLFGV